MANIKVDGQLVEVPDYFTLMQAAEATARECGKTLLVLDAVTGGDAARLYERLGWVRVGDIPGFALMPRGELCGTTYFYRNV